MDGAPRCPYLKYFILFYFVFGEIYRLTLKDEEGEDKERRAHLCFNLSQKVLGRALLSTFYGHEHWGLKEVK